MPHGSHIENKNKNSYDKSSKQLLMEQFLSSGQSHPKNIEDSSLKTSPFMAENLNKDHPHASLGQVVTNFNEVLDASLK